MLRFFKRSKSRNEDSKKAKFEDVEDAERCSSHAVHRRENLETAANYTNKNYSGNGGAGGGGVDDDNYNFNTIRAAENRIVPTCSSSYNETAIDVARINSSRGKASSFLIDIMGGKGRNRRGRQQQQQQSKKIATVVGAASHAKNLGENRKNINGPTGARTGEDDDEGARNLEQK